MERVLTQCPNCQQYLDTEGAHGVHQGNELVPGHVCLIGDRRVYLSTEELLEECIRQQNGARALGVPYHWDPADGDEPF